MENEKALCYWIPVSPSVGSFYASLVSTSPRSPGRRKSPARVEQPSLFEFLILSMLLHLLVIVLFGNPGGSSLRRDEESWNPLDIRLRQPNSEPGTGFRRAPGAETTAPGSALLPRTGAAPSTPSTTPGTQQPSAAPAPPEPQAERPEAFPEAPPAAPPEKEATPRAPSPPREAKPGLNLEAPQEIDRSFAVEPPLRRLAPPTLESPLTTPAELAPHEAPISPAVPLGRITPALTQRELAPPLELIPREAPVTPAAPVERMVAPRFEPEIAAPAELTPRELPSPAAPIERIAPRAERRLAPPAEMAPNELPVAPSAPPIERIAPQKTETELVQPAELQPAQIPTLPGAPIERIAPATAAPLERFAPPAELRAPARTGGEGAPAQRPSPKSERETAPAARPAPGESLPQVQRGAPSGAPETTSPAPPPERFHFGSPTPEEELFKPRGNVMPALDEPGLPPYIDLEGARREAAREVLREGAGSRGILALPVPPPPEYKSREARAMEKAIKPDCRTEYAALGLFAVPALLISALADTGCRW